MKSLSSSSELKYMIVLLEFLLSSILSASDEIVVFPRKISDRSSLDGGTVVTMWYGGPIGVSVDAELLFVDNSSKFKWNGWRLIRLLCV